MLYAKINGKAHETAHAAIRADPNRDTFAWQATYSGGNVCTHYPMLQAARPFWCLFCRSRKLPIDVYICHTVRYGSRQKCGANAANGTAGSGGGAEAAIQLKIQLLHRPITKCVATIVRRPNAKQRPKQDRARQTESKRCCSVRAGEQESQNATETCSLFGVLAGFWPYAIRTDTLAHAYVRTQAVFRCFLGRAGGRGVGNTPCDR